MYKTGDRARYRADGSIEILGRLDEQVKVNGFRMEPGEITSVLLQHPAVSEAVVILRTETYGEKRLVAYFVPRQEHNPDSAELRDFIRRFLPPYMIPAFFIALPSIPLTPNGKMDRKALPVPGDLLLLTGYVAPRSDAEKIMTGIWQNTLHLEQVGIHDNFFELGGASIQSLQIVAKANLYGIRISVENLFEFQTIADLVEFAGTKGL
jgi:nonribosomal peptide synthetase DhbF